MADDESLFSLEVIVESLDNMNVSCHKPAVAFRLLDFPTVVIRSEQEFRANETPYEIQSGKSCLFKMNAHFLRDRLRDTPLYIMLVDASFTNIKLLASTTISLVSCFKKIHSNIENNGFDMPAVSGEKGEYEMYNLMGSCVATVTLAFRMFSFGVGITGHVDHSLSKRIKQKNRESIPTGPLTLFEEPGTTNIVDKASPQQTEQNTSNKKISDKLSTVEHTSTVIADADTQTDMNSEWWKSMKLLEKCDTPSIQCHNNITRPPPLYYNSISTFVNLTVFTESSEKQVRNRNDESTGARVVSSMSGKLVKYPNDEIHFRPGYFDASVQTSNGHQGDTSRQCSNSKQLSLPLIEALLDELSLVRTKYVNDSLPQQSHEQCTPPHQSKQVRIHDKDHVFSNNPQDQKIGKTKRADKKRKTAPPVSRKGAILSKPARANKKGVLISRNPVNFEKSSLKYGTTKTQKLREAMNKRNLRLVENREGVPNIVAGNLFPKQGLKPAENMPCNKHVEQKAEQISKENKSTMTHNREWECKDFGIQVKMSDHFSGTTQKCFSQDMLFGCINDGVSNVILGATYKCDSIPVSAASASNQAEGNADKLFSAANCDEVPNVSPSAYVATNRRYTYGERNGSELQERVFSSDDGFSDKTRNLVDAPVGRVNVNPESCGKESCSLDRRISDGSLASVNKPIGNVSGNDERLGKESPGRSSLHSRLSDESMGLVSKPVGKVLSNSTFSENFDSNVVDVLSKSSYSDNFDSDDASDHESKRSSDVSG